MNNRRAFHRATEFLLDLGHRRIGLVNGLEFMDFAIRRRTGYLDALAARGIATDPALMTSIEMTEGRAITPRATCWRWPIRQRRCLLSSMISPWRAPRD